MSPTGPRYPTVGVDSGSGGNVAWTNPSNALVEDGTTAQSLNIGGGNVSNQLIVKTFGFTIPSTAIIDGIVMEVKCNANRGSTPNVFLNYNGGTSKAPTASNPNWGVTGLTWLTYGGPTDLWGKAWTPADINDALFGGSISASPFSGSGWTYDVDSVRITVYWHTAPTDVPKRYSYKVYDNASGVYLGDLPNVVSDFGYAQDINTAGSQMNVECATSMDTAYLPNDIYTAEDGVTPYTDEAAASNYTTEGVIPMVSTGAAGLPTLIRNGNRIVVWEYSYYYPNGRQAFTGQINRWSAGFGQSGGESIKILVLSDGMDMDNLVARGAPFTYTTDQSQTSQNSNETISTTRAGYVKSGQTFQTGSGQTNLGAISLMLNGTANVTVRLWDSIAQVTLLGSVTQPVAVGGATVIQFGFAVPIVVTGSTSYFFSVEVDDGQSITIYYQNTDVYASGQHCTAVYGGGSGGGAFSVATGDLYFVTGSSSGSTTGTYTSQDPSIGMLKPIIDDYKARGGRINYATGSVDATGLSLTYTFNTNTIYEALKAILSIAPNGFYYYVDVGTDVLYFKQTSAAADITLVKGKHLNDFTIAASIENVKNQVLFSGGATGGVNLYKQYQSQKSMSLYGTRLDRKSDNRVTVSATADAIGNTAISSGKDEVFMTTLTIVDKTMDTTLLKVGKLIGFAGFGSFADSILMQIVRVEYSPESVTLGLGMIPKRLNLEFEKITRGLVAQQTVANPTAPS